MAEEFSERLTGASDGASATSRACCAGISPQLTAKDHGRARAQAVRRAASEPGADRIGQSEAQHYQRQPLRPEAWRRRPGRRRDTYSRPVKVPATVSTLVASTASLSPRLARARRGSPRLAVAPGGWRLARQPSEDPEQRERRQPRHAETRSRQ